MAEVSQEKLPKEETSPDAPLDTTFDTSPILGNGEAAELADLADLKITHKDNSRVTIFRCHSSALACQSKVICKMFAATDKEGWEAGLNALFAGHRADSVNIVLSMMYGGPNMVTSNLLNSMGDSSAPKSWPEVEDVMRLLQKLDVPKALDVSYIYLSIVNLYLHIYHDTNTHSHNLQAVRIKTFVN